MSIEYLIKDTHSEWHGILAQALEKVDKNYLIGLQENKTWLPGGEKLLAAFKLPFNSMRYILLGESPYPRPKSANGYAFWDAAVHSLWSKTGLSKEVNRATSLRNWIKMLLIARGDLARDSSQAAIAALDKSAYWQTAEQFFNSLTYRKGFLLLNATLAYQDGEVAFHAKKWRPFMSSLLEQLAQSKPSLQLILFGRIAQQIPEARFFTCLIAEHPYNLSFITNPRVLEFFKPLDLLSHD